MTIELSALQQQRRDTAANWTGQNPTLLNGEIGYETDTGKFKIGDGSTAWTSLNYLPIPDSNGLIPIDQLLLPAGTAAAPSLTFTGDVNTGIYSPGADQFGISTAGSAALTIDSSQRVGIGISSPQTRLHCLGTTNGAQATFGASSSGLKISTFQKTDNDAGVILDAQQSSNGTLTFATAGTEQMRIDSSGNVGMGTSSPSHELHVAGAGTVAYFEGSGGSGFIGIEDTDDNTSAFIGVDGGSLKFQTSGNSYSDKLVIDSSGRVLIGTATEGNADADALTISSTGGYTGITLRSDTNQGGAIYFSDATSGAGEYDGYITYAQSNQSMSFGTAGNGSPRMLIDSTGNVVIGTTSAATDSRLTVRAVSPALSLYATPGNESFLNMGDTDDHNIGRITYDNSNNAMRFDTNAAERMRIDSSGFVLIGTTVSSSLSDRLLTVGQGSRAASYLEIRSSSTGDGGLLFSDGTSGNAGYRGQVVYSHSIDALQFWTAATERMRINSSGEFRHTPGGATSSTYMKSNVENTNEYVFKVFRDGAHSTAITFQTQISGAGAERMRIDSSGRLLVGTSSSRAMYGSVNNRVQIEGDGHANSSLSLTRTGGSAPQINLASSADTSFGLVSNGGDLGIIAFMGADGSAMRNAASISGEVDGTPGANDMPGRLVFSTTADGAASPTERLRITDSGETFTFAATNGWNFRTGSSANTSNTILQGAYGATSTLSGTTSIFIYSNGDIKNTNNSYGGISDIKLKENIVDANSQWDDIKDLRVRNYNFIEGQTHTQIGVVAQEVETVSPGLVTESPDRDEEGNDLGTTTKSVNYSVLYMKAVKALQEAMERIETLEASNADLLARVSALEAN